MIKNPFEDFIKEEYEWVYNENNISVLLNRFDGKITEEEFYDNYDEFINRATESYCNNEWIIQEIHDFMHEILIDVIKDYLANK